MSNGSLPSTRNTFTELLIAYTSIIPTAPGVMSTVCNRSSSVSTTLTTMRDSLSLAIAAFASAASPPKSFCSATCMSAIFGQIDERNICQFAARRYNYCHILDCRHRGRAHQCERHDRQRTTQRFSPVHSRHSCNLPIGIPGVSARAFLAASIEYEQIKSVAKVVLQVTSRHTCPFVQLRQPTFER